MPFSGGILVGSGGIWWDMAGRRQNRNFFSPKTIPVFTFRAVALAGFFRVDSARLKLIGTLKRTDRPAGLIRIVAFAVVWLKRRDAILGSYVLKIGDTAGGVTKRDFTGSKSNYARSREPPVETNAIGKSVLRNWNCDTPFLISNK